MNAYIYGLVDPRDNQIHYVGHTVDMLGRFGGHMMDHADTPKTRWIADVFASNTGDVRIVQLAEVPYAERFQYEYKWIYLGRAMGWPLTNTVAMKTETYTHLMDGLGSTLIVELEHGLTWRKLGTLTYPLGLLLLAVGAMLQMAADATGDYNTLFVAAGCVSGSVLLYILGRWLRDR